MNHLHDSHDESESSHERWLVSYADLMTLMFAFFTVLYATSSENTEKAKEFQESIKRYLIKAGPMGGPAQGSAKTHELGDTPFESPIQVFKQTRGEAAAEAEKVLEKIEGVTSEEDRRKFLNDVYTDDLGLRIVLFGSTVFAPGLSEKFNPDAIQFLNQLAPVLATSKRRLVIESMVGAGQKGTFKNSWELASARAINFLRFLELKHQISATRLSAVSRGDSEAAAAGKSSSVGDRLEIVLVHEDLDM